MVSNNLQKGVHASNVFFEPSKRQMQRPPGSAGGTLVIVKKTAVIAKHTTTLAYLRPLPALFGSVRVDYM